MGQPTTDEQDRTDTPFAAGEVETLLGFLDYQRQTFAWKCRGLTDAQLRAPLHPTVMTLGGMLKHLARVEDQWFSEVVAEGSRLDPWAGMDWAAEWSNHVDQTGDELRQLWEERVARSRTVVAAALMDDLSTTHPAWGGQGQVSLRWVLLHMIEEYARHVGHADLLREAAAGQTGE
jgi:uncharacterized damage-inducible protein DinB